MSSKDKRIVAEARDPRGSVALLRAIKPLETIQTANSDQKAGADIREDIGAGKYAYDYDAQTGENADLVKHGIIYPTKVVRPAIQDAASIAGMLIIPETTIAGKVVRADRPNARSAEAEI